MPLRDPDDWLLPDAEDPPPLRDALWPRPAPERCDVVLWAITDSYQLPWGEPPLCWPP